MNGTGRQRPRHEPYDEEVHDACGVGFLADMNARPSAEVLRLALLALARMAHRGAVDADGRTGDGAGVCTQIPHALFARERATLRCEPDALAIGSLFLSADAREAARAQRLIEAVLMEHGYPLPRWRDVPVDDAVLGRKALESKPTLVQLFIARPAAVQADQFEAHLVALRRVIEARAEHAGVRDLYVVSLSHRTIVYKALVRAIDLAAYYPDLRDPRFETAFALIHQRFSTNTAPSWSMTQPFRLSAHNGEINTIEGNRRWMHARGADIEAFGIGGLRGAAPIAPVRGTSDSSSFDDALATLTAAGRSAAHGMTLLMPPAWEHDDELAPRVRAFFDYQASLMEPWDGPALVVFTDGHVVGASLDRNGLRPARVVTTTDGLVLVSSEIGVLDIDDSRIATRGRLGPGGMVVVDLQQQRLVDRDTLLDALSESHPYWQWVAKRRIPMDEVRASRGPAAAPASDVRSLRAMGCTREELLLILGPMYKDGVEPLGSMGDDSPLAVLSASSRSLFSHFRQRFAQVTNPPIDSLRETVVMSLDVRLGAAGPLLVDGPLTGHHVYLESPILAPGDVDALLALRHEHWRSESLSLRFREQDGIDGFASALDELVRKAELAVQGGSSCLVLTDRGIYTEEAALPTLLAAAAVHQHLCRLGIRLRASIVVDAGDARDEHALAALFAFGVDAVCPRGGYEAIGYACASEDGVTDPAVVAHACTAYQATLKKGLLKILAKMGVSTLRSYRGAGLFEAIGVGEDVIAEHFTGTRSTIGGMGMGQIAEDTLERHRSAFATTAPALEEGGWHRYRKDGDAHAFEPRVVKALHSAIRSGKTIDYKSYASLVHERAPLAIRDLMEIRLGDAIPVHEVESTQDILTRFMSAAMSLGSLSPEAQQTVAIAMNRIGARSNSGEGGEPAELFWRPAPGSDRASNRIKQIASGRFGVSAAYLNSADELQIKMAQGSKPGEGGQIPGIKVTEQIARVRHASVGTTLISPPPHHDIYSIEDLAQLIYDLKRVNPAATVSVKLVSSEGIGTIAVGVAKAHADAIQISGHDGGTGASPRGSIKNAGAPWELGLSEAHQALVRGGLRGRVRLQVDGGFKTGRDVVLAALLGAEEFGFGTAALVAAGCLMARQCHLNTCPVGIATQREDLRKKFKGTPEDVIKFFVAVAEEVREILALMGVRRLLDIVGRTELIEERIPETGKASSVHLDRILVPSLGDSVVRHGEGVRNDPPRTGTGIDERLLEELRIDDGFVEPIELLLPITNADRAVGALVAGEIVRRTNAGRVPPRTVQLHLRGSAGQSFGAFCVDGMRLVLDGDTNDYVGKGMSGGEIVVRRPAASRDAVGQVIAGNTLLYGATGGFAYIAGTVGERFGVRNSGAVAVVEGTGDHACEYMTAGGIVILGPTGRNVGAGMTGGVMFALDSGDELMRRTHNEWVDIARSLSGAEEHWVHELLLRHLHATGSRFAEWLHLNWEMNRHRFRRVAPRGQIECVLPSLRRADAHVPSSAPTHAPMRQVSGSSVRSAPAAPV